MINILLLYHSGTGTTRIIVDIIELLLKNESNYNLKIYSLPGDDDGNYDFINMYDGVILIYPCYYFDASAPVLHFLEKLPVLKKPVPLYQVVTRSFCSANTIRKVAKRCTPHNLITAGYQDIRTPGVDAMLIIPMVFFTSYQKSTLKKIIKCVSDIKKIVLEKKIKIKKPFIKWYSAIGYLFVKIISNEFRKHIHNLFIDDDCTNCNKCITFCAFHCWETGKPKPKRTEKECILCLNCIHKCPQKAILYNKNIKNKPRFIQADYDNWKASFLDSLSIHK